MVQRRYHARRPWSDFADGKCRQDARRRHFQTQESKTSLVARPLVLNVSSGKASPAAAASTAAFQGGQRDAYQSQKFYCYSWCASFIQGLD
jgi:hypothetical protein